VKATTVILANSSIATGTVNLNNGGTLQAASITKGAGTANFNWNDGTIQNYDAGTDLYIDSLTLNLAATGTHAFNIDPGRIGTVAGNITGSGSLTKVGAGTLTLTGTNSYGGNTTIDGGTLRISTSNSLPTGSLVTLRGGTLDLRNDTGTAFNNVAFVESPSTINVDCAVLGSGRDQTHSLGGIRQSAPGADLSITGDHGYGLEIGSLFANFDMSITNEAPGTVVIRGYTFGNVHGRLSISGAGNTLISEYLVAFSSQSFSLNKTGSGTLTLAGESYFNGTVTVEGGTFDVLTTLRNNGSDYVHIKADDTGATKMIRHVLDNGLTSYAGIGSAVVGGEFDTTADIVAGDASGATDVGMSWQLRTGAEKTQAGGGLISDVLSLDGIALSGGGIHNGSHQTDMFVLQMSYSPSELLSIWGLTEAEAVAQDRLYLGSLDLGADGLVGTADDQWIRAVAGNFGGSCNSVGDHAYNSSYSALGNYGVDTTNHVVWAVLNHNSQFAAVPEPSSVAMLLGIALTALLYYWHRHV
jgi:autotransporter-associated beta strand protein